MSKNSLKDAIIVKVQQSLESSDKEKSILVYDKARVLFFESKDPGVVMPLLDKLGKEPKKYFKALMKGNELKLFEEMKDEKW